jgi:ketosteroid isomerase-like protein
VILEQPTAQQAADVVAIQQLAASYSEAMGRGAVDEAVQVYAPEGVLRSPTTEDAVGRDAIAAVIATTISTLEFVFQTLHDGLVHVDGDRANARFTITEWSRRKHDGVGLLFLGYYEDEVARLPEGWRFQSRLLVPRTLGKVDFFKGKVHDLAALRAVL